MDFWTLNTSLRLKEKCDKSMSYHELCSGYLSKSIIELNDVIFSMFHYITRNFWNRHTSKKLLLWLRFSDLRKNKSVNWNFILTIPFSIDSNLVNRSILALRLICFDLTDPFLFAIIDRRKSIYLYPYQAGISVPDPVKVLTSDNRGNDYLNVKKMKGILFVPKW